MAIGALNGVPVDTSQLVFRTLNVSPKLDFETKAQQVDRATGVSLWSLDVLVDKKDGSVSTATVTIPATEAPALTPLSTLSFAGLTASTYGSAGLLLRATSVTMSRPAAARSEQ